MTALHTAEPSLLVEVFKVVACLTHSVPPAFGAVGTTGLNNNDTPDQMISHLHVHVIPRYDGDNLVIPNPGKAPAPRDLRLQLATHLRQTLSNPTASPTRRTSRRGDPVIIGARMVTSAVPEVRPESFRHVGRSGTGRRDTGASTPPTRPVIAFSAYSVQCMGLYDVEIEPEIRDWLDSLADRDFGRVDWFVALLAENAETLGEPWSRHLGDGLRELRLHLHPREVRVTYWLAPGRRIVLLTVFCKSREREIAEVERAMRARKQCEAGHGHAQGDDYIREV